MKTMTVAKWVAKGALAALVACSVQAELETEEDPSGWAGAPQRDAESGPAGGDSASERQSSISRSRGTVSGPSTGGASPIGGSGGYAPASGGSQHTGGSSHGNGGTSSGGTDTGGVPPCQDEQWYRDADGDGYGDPDDSVSACSKPAGYVDNADDCYDDNAAARPGQTSWFTSHRGDGSFDYDCSGSEERRRSSFAGCPDFDEYDDHSCPPANLWPDGYSVLSCLPDPSHPQCYCDYYGMSARFEEAKDGWRPIVHYEQCAEGMCPVYQELPGCGEVGTWGLQITWNAAESSWKCVDAETPGSASLMQSCR